MVEAVAAAAVEEESPASLPTSECLEEAVEEEALLPTSPLSKCAHPIDSIDKEHTRMIHGVLHDLGLLHNTLTQ